MQLDSRSVCREILAFRDVFADKQTHTHARTHARTHTHTQTYAYYNTAVVPEQSKELLRETVFLVSRNTSVKAKK